MNSAPSIPRHVMVFSRNTAMVRSLLRALYQSGHHATVCESSLEALAAVEVIRPDVMLVDLETPGLKGLLLVSALKRLAPGLGMVAVSTRPRAEETRALAQQGIPCVTVSLDVDGAEDAVLAELAHIGPATPAVT